MHVYLNGIMSIVLLGYFYIKGKSIEYIPMLLLELPSLNDDNKKQALLEQKKSLQGKTEEVKQSRSKELLKQKPIEILDIEINRIEKYPDLVPMSQSLFYSSLSRFISSSILDYTLENRKNTIGTLAIPFASSFLLEFIERQVIDRYQYKERVNDAEYKYCSPAKNNGLIIWFSFLQATVAASSVLAASMIQQRYGEGIYNIVNNLAPNTNYKVINFAASTIASIIAKPRAHIALCDLICNKILSYSEYTREVQCAR
jgi:hypothetical protein